MNKSHKLKAATRLLEIQADPAYLNEWLAILAKPNEEFEEVNEEPIVIFRLNGEWLALSAYEFKEIIPCKKIHAIPHRSNKTILGLVNIRGQLRLCVSMHHLLGVSESSAASSSPQSQERLPRMVCIHKGEQKWVFPADEVYGIYRLNLEQKYNVPITVSKSTANYLEGMFELQDKIVGLINKEVLFESLLRSCHG